MSKDEAKPEAVNSRNSSKSKKTSRIEVTPGMFSGAAQTVSPKAGIVMAIFTVFTDRKSVV